MVRQNFYHVPTNSGVDDWQGNIIPLKEAAELTKKLAGVGQRRLYELIQKAIKHYKGQSIEGDMELLNSLYHRCGRYFLDRQGITDWALKRDRPKPYIRQPGSESFY